MGGLVIVVLDPRSLALLALAGVLELVRGHVVIPQAIWGPMSADLSDPLAFGLHGWLERARERVRLLKHGAGARPIELGRSASIVVLSERSELRRTCREAGRAALVGASAAQVVEALQDEGAVPSATAALDAAYAALEARASAGRRLGPWADDVEAARRLLAHLDHGQLSLA